ncbi:sulfite exporter TauE/SafE family protein 3-like isoform X2 [Phoenix dactylifera]|uniref:Sulfite exporter TauE/SafE family protein 3-like isoform X2 n=1 Tax=Phoenix dactylifera TaxID=42345 RepID=A0A8B8ZJX9_PHODC|nr:sulfite exporter TauE/SafE family protein 3-like isoform X2 [Phoenix dactylifera]XP_038973612.1 sulfite exporter TauE/SafE family protein 3-like isoform X2 [Phoenix dactylifera]
MEGDTDEEAAKRSQPNSGGNQEVEYKPLAIGPSNDGQKENMVTADPEVPVLQNICWKELGLLVFVWMAFLVLQIPKNYTATCSIWFGVLNLLQIPASVAVTVYETISLYKGKRMIASKGHEGTNWRVHRLFIHCSLGVIAALFGAWHSTTGVYHVFTYFHRIARQLFMPIF